MIEENRLQLLNRILDGKEELTVQLNLSIAEWRYLKNNGYCLICHRKCQENH